MFKKIITITHFTVLCITSFSTFLKYFFFRFQSTMDAEIKNSSSSSKIIINKCVVKGYHAFKIRPPFTSPPTRLLVDRECLVWLPPLNKFPPHMHDNITDAKRQLKLSDIAGLPIGHVPRCLSSHFRDIFDNGGGDIC